MIKGDCLRKLIREGKIFWIVSCGCSGVETDSQISRITLVQVFGMK